MFIITVNMYLSMQAKKHIDAAAGEAEAEPDMS